MRHKKAWAAERLELGRIGEAKAVLYLTRLGYEIITRNYRTPLGEIDIIAREGRQLVFVEVRTRASASLGPPFLSVTRKKQRKIIHNALCYVKRYGLTDSPWRIDIVSVKLKDGHGVDEILLFRDAVLDHFYI
ncbi:YraN family protein [Candidatus Omnitrophota bacterium]